MTAGHSPVDHRAHRTVADGHLPRVRMTYRGFACDKCHRMGAHMVAACGK